MLHKRYALLRYASIGTGIVSGFVQISLYTKYLSQENTAILVIISGYSIFLSWIDAGLSRPVYPKLRKSYLDGEDVRQELIYLQYFYMVMGSIAVILFSIVVILLGQMMTNSLSLVSLTVMGINLSINTSISFYKNIFNAVDKYISFEITELIRRFSNIISSLFLIVDPSLMTTVFSQLIVYLGVYCYVMRSLLVFSGGNLIALFCTRISSVRDYVLQYSQDTKNYLLFMINETLIYNCGYFVFPAFMSSQQIVMFGIWSRIYSGMATFVRALSDVTIHSITENYFQGRFHIAKRFLYRTLLLSLSLSMGMLATFFVLHTNIMEIWVHGQYDLSLWALVGLGGWVLGNTIQHVAGTFIVSVGEYFSVIRNISLFLVIGIVLATSIGAWVTGDVGISLSLSACIYILGALVYQQKSRNAFLKNSI